MTLFVYNRERDVTDLHITHISISHVQVIHYVSCGPLHTVSRINVLHQALQSAFITLENLKSKQYLHHIEIKAIKCHSFHLVD